MADRITDERLLEIAKHGIASAVSESEVRYCAAKLLNARAEVERLRRDLKEAVCLLVWCDFDDEENPECWTVEERELVERRRELLARHKETP